MRENNLEEVEVLTKRFKDYIDKVQVTLDNVDKVTPKPGDSEADSAGKFYTVVSPAEVMTNNMKSVLSALEKAIVNIEKISDIPTEVTLSFADAGGDTGKKNYSKVSMTNRIFSTDELEFLSKTFDKILNASKKERNRIFEDHDKIDNS